MSRSCDMKVKTYQQPMPDFSTRWFVEIVEDRHYRCPAGAQLTTVQYGIFIDQPTPDKCGFASRTAARAALTAYKNCRGHVKIIGGLH